MTIQKKLAKSICFYSNPRSLLDIEFIVIHWTSNENDTAKNNAIYFSDGIDREAGANFFVDSKEIWQSIPMKYSAKAVGGFYTKVGGAGKFYKKCTNSNSVSIELCNFKGNATWEQLLLTRQLVLYIQEQCPNAKTIIRHWDVNGKDCPHGLTGLSNKKWNFMLKFLKGKADFYATVTEHSNLFLKPDIESKKVGTKEKKEEVHIKKQSGNFGLLSKPDKYGNKQWIRLSHIRKEMNR